MKKLVIDADYYLYAAGFATEGEPENYSCQALKTMLGNITEAVKPDEVEIYVSGKGNFRDEVAVTQPYKGNREGRKPTNYPAMYQYVTEILGAEKVDGMETDDMVSMLLYEDFVANEGDRDRCNVILCSIDKDLNNTPGWHYNSKKENLYFVSDRQALRHFWFQMLCGDKTDHIPGLPVATPWIDMKYSTGIFKGFADNSAKKVIASTVTAEEAKEAAIACYISWGIFHELDSDEIYKYIMEQGTLLWMVRERDDFGEIVTFELDRSEYDRLYEQHATVKGGYAGYDTETDDGGDSSGSPVHSEVGGDDRETDEGTGGLQPDAVADSV